jgi:hypothetical protein
MFPHQWLPKIHKGLNIDATWIDNIVSGVVGAVAGSSIAGHIGLIRHRLANERQIKPTLERLDETLTTMVECLGAISKGVDAHTAAAEAMATIARKHTGERQ